MFNFDSLGKVIIALREDDDVAAITERIRGFEPGPGDADTDAQASGPRFKHAFVVLSTLATPRMGRLPVQRPRIGGRFYGRTPQEAMALYVACSNALHLPGPRVHSNGLGIYTSLDETGGSQDKDPDTQQPFVSAVFELFATTQAVSV